MIKHIVLWTLKNRENEQDREETAAAIKQKIEGMRGKIPGLLHIEGGVDFTRIGRLVGRRAVCRARIARGAGGLSRPSCPRGVQGVHRPAPEPALADRLRSLRNEVVSMTSRRRFLVLAGLLFVVGLTAAAAVAAGASRRPGILAPRHGVVRTGRRLPLRQPAVQRAGVPVRRSRACADDEARPRVHGRRPRTELHLHRRHEAGDGVHRRRPARQSRSASDVQGALRAVGGSGGVRVAPVFEEAAGRPEREIDRPPKSSARSGPSRPTTGSSART